MPATGRPVRATGHLSITGQQGVGSKSVSIVVVVLDDVEVLGVDPPGTVDGG